MQAYFYTVSKRRNSTKRGTGGSTIDIILKDGCSNINPTIALKWSGSGSPTFNQMYVPDWDRYYWIDSWTFTDRQWVASCSVDVLASFKDTINNSYKYILRAASAYNDNIIDSKYPPCLPVTHARTAITGLAWATQFDYGRFVVGIVGQGNTFQAAGAGYVVLTPTQLQQLIDACFTETNAIWTSSSSLGTDVGEALAKYGENYMKSIQNPIQFINSIMWVPFIPATASTPITVKLGAINTNISASPLADPVHVDTFSSTFDPMWSRNRKWKAVEPFVHYTFHCPPFSDHVLPADKVLASGGVTGSIYCDVTSGLATINIEAGGATVASSSAQMGIPIQLSGSSVDYAGIIKGATNTIGGTIGKILSGDIAGAITGAVSGIQGVAEAAQPQATNGGYTGGMGALKDSNANRGILVTLYSIPEEDIADEGEPLMKMDYILGYSGYLLLADGHVDILGTPEESAQINEFLTGGFYNE